jgi:hypothetical protein
MEDAWEAVSDVATINSTHELFEQGFADAIVSADSNRGCGCKEWCIRGVKSQIEHLGFKGSGHLLPQSWHAKGLSVSRDRFKEVKDLDKK